MHGLVAILQAPLAQIFARPLRRDAYLHRDALYKAQNADSKGQSVLFLQVAKLVGNIDE